MNPDTNVSRANFTDAVRGWTQWSGRVVATEYDPAGRIAGVRPAASTSYYAGAASTDPVNRLQYAAHGAMSALQLGNGLWEHTTFNSRLQPTEIGLGATSADANHLRLSYSYGTTENNGNVRTQTITAPNLTLQQTYTYDELNRLATAQESTGTQQVWQQSYSYDRYGNRAVAAGSFILNAAQTPQSLAAFTANTNRLTNGSYDNAGNLTVDAEGHTYAYDGENRQLSYDGGASSSGGANYYYDGDGRRVKKVAGVVTTIFVYNVLGQLVAEYMENQPQSQSSGTSYVTVDTLGSTRARSDAAGVVKERHDYLPFGEELYAAGGRSTVPGYMQDSVRQKFTGYERDNETGLDYAQARYYSSTQGRFTSVDPFNPILNKQASANPRAAGSEFIVWISKPQRWNRYTYALNNPLRYLDQDGEDPQEALEALSKAVQRLGRFSELARGMVTTGKVTVYTTATQIALESLFGKEVVFKAGNLKRASEIEFAKEVSAFEGRSFLGMDKAGMDGFLHDGQLPTSNPQPIQLQENSRGGMSRIEDDAFEHEYSAQRARLKNLDLYVKATDKDVTVASVLNSIKNWGDRGGLVTLTNRGTFKSVTILAQDGVVRVDRGKVYSCDSSGRCHSQ